MTSTISERIAKQSKSLPVATGLQREAEERERGRRREREEARARMNSHHALWEGGYQYRQQLQPNSTT
ncbi:hypothetical protein GBAR_LOCUS15694 [Geodia barretti]|uniref:Uncharacterized protein n=1 Tax=Geodia barretti TaxID=519541 RepID=A0AA35SDG0_GEOBA|nr:hypothetical protein GBAR_LOCUS15694 [Geodia barretti]